jgi:hypothetical protein
VMPAHLTKPSGEGERARTEGRVCKTASADAATPGGPGTGRPVASSLLPESAVQKGDRSW